MQTDLKKLKIDLMDIRRRVATFVAETEGEDRAEVIGDLKQRIDAVSGIAYGAQRRDERFQRIGAEGKAIETLR